MSDDYKPLIHKDKVPTKTAYCGEIAGQLVAVCQYKGEYYAFENRCSHARATFDGGRLKAYRIACPLHGATFDIRDGSVTGLPAKKPIKVFPLRIDDTGMIEIDVSDADV